jgi:hypothetical protein
MSISPSSHPTKAQRVGFEVAAGRKTPVATLVVLAHGLADSASVLQWQEHVLTHG